MGYLLCCQQNGGAKLSIEDALAPTIPSGSDGRIKCRNPYGCQQIVLIEREWLSRMVDWDKIHFGSHYAYVGQPVPKKLGETFDL